MMSETSVADTALVLFSGGQDSATCVAWALSRYQRVETLGFDYGQRHAVELTLRPALLSGLRALQPEWTARLGEDHLLDLSLLGEISDTALTRDTEIVMQENGLPTTFVPGRNLLFITVAAALAYRRGLQVLVGGMCETDYSGYPDCRNDTLTALEKALQLGMESHIAESLGGDALVELIRTDTHTCYLGERGELHDWGHGCGRCPACELRARGYGEYQAGRYGR
jgi:7-cyano-7-deazaguanine synthase